MPESLHSASWYRVASLVPSLRSHARFHRHRYRGRVWYVLHDRSTQRSHRLSPAAYAIVGLMNGERTLQQIWDLVGRRLGDEAPTQDETIRLLGMLHASDALRSDVSPDVLEFVRRRTRREQPEWWRRFTNPLSIRIPLGDPDALLERWLPVVRPLVSWPAAVLAVALLATATVLAVAHRGDLARGAAETLLAPHNLLLLVFVYPVVKALHELGHAFATKAWGGDVHEVGILFLVGMPVPYVDASAAAAFPQKRRRALVGAAGIAMELCLAALALLVWLAVEPGLVRSIAYDVMWIGGVSTLLFNGNPLLRFDGYYVLADLVEMPNLASRSRQYLLGLLIRHVCGVEQVRNPANAPGEERWFVAYGLAAAVYRVFVLLGIALFVSEKLLAAGVALAAFAIATQLVVPLLRGAGFVLTSPRLADGRSRALLGAGVLAVALATLALVVPFPSRTLAEGVVWPPEGAELRAHGDGFVEALLAAPGSAVGAGDPLVRTREPALEAEVAVLEAQLRELRARHHAERGVDRVRARMTAEQLRTAEAALAHGRRRVGEEVLRSPAEGFFVLSRPHDLIGRFVRKGELVGYVLGASVDTVRVVIEQADVARVRGRTRDVRVRLSRRIGEVLPAQVRREVPGAGRRLPSRALGSAGGGRVPVDPSDAEGLTALEPVFQLELGLPRDLAVAEIGGRAYVRLDHGAESLAAQALRGLRRLLLRRLGV